MIKVFYTGAKAGVKYTPAIVAVAKQVRGPATDYAKAKIEESRQKRLAVAKASSVVDGTLLPVPHGETVVWVVFTGDKAVAEYPDVAVPPGDLVVDADLGKRKPPEAFPSAKERATAAGHAAATKVRHPRGSKDKATKDKAPKDKAPKDKAPKDKAITDKATTDEKA